MKKTKKPKTWKVYCVYSPSRGLFYVGQSCKSGVPYDNYYGSGNYTEEWEDKVKVTLAEYDKVSWAKFCELQLQLQYRLDDRCVNAMFQFRCNGNHLKLWSDMDATSKLADIVSTLTPVTEEP